MIQVTYYAGAADAAGDDAVEVDPGGPMTVAELVTLLGTGNEAFADVLEACTVLVDGEAAPPDALVPADASVDVMPPFAGG